MIPILYPENENTFTSNGIGRLSDAITCIVTEERNGDYTLKLEYPIDGMMYEEIRYSRIIWAIPSDGTRAQPFRIYKITTPLGGRITVLAEHISYQLSHIPCGACVGNNPSHAFAQIVANAYEDCPFTFWTDKSTSATYTQTVPASIRSRLGGVSGSILDVYGGEYEWDRYVVKLHNSRGENRGVTLRYGKNITDINQEENIENTITGICPYWASTDGTTVVTLPEKVVYSDHASEFPYNRTVVVDFTSDFQDEPTESELRARAQSYIASSGVGIPSISIKVSFVALYQTEEYKDIALLERVKLCDTVNIHFEKLGIDATAKVIKTDYNVLQERYDSIELGDAKSSLAQKVYDLQVESREKVTSTAMERAIEHATTLITGGLGGYVVYTLNADGQPEEILIMDTDDVTTAVNVIRMNKNGIGFSTNGYAGPFTTAWTIDGSFVADFITSGTLNSIRIEGNTIDGNTITGGTISGTTITGTTINGNTISGGTISGATISGNTISGGTISGATISGNTISGGTVSGATVSGGTVSGTTISGGTVTGATISGNTISGGTISGTTITNGSNFSVNADGIVSIVNGSFRVSLEDTDTLEWLSISQDQAQINIVNHDILTNTDETVVGLNYDSLTFQYQPTDGHPQGYASVYGRDGFNIAGSIIVETYLEDEEDPQSPYHARFRTNEIYDISGAGVNIYNGPDQNSWTHRLAFQADGNLVIYDTEGNAIWSAGVTT